MGAVQSRLAAGPQAAWNGVHAKMLTGPNAKPTSVFIIGGVLVYLTCFLGPGLVLQLKAVKEALKHYKIQPDAAPSPKLLEPLRHHAIQGLLLQPAALYILSKMFYGCGTSTSKTLPSLGRVLSRLVLWHVLFDTWFYWAHRACHQPFLYKHIHSIHHRFKSPVGMAATFAHPLEELFVNFASTIVGPLLFPCHITTWWIFYIIRATETVEAHSGYDLPYSLWKTFPLSLIHGGSSRHDYHHSHVNKGCYGGFTFWDWAMGTDVDWRKHRAEGGK